MPLVSYNDTKVGFQHNITIIVIYNIIVNTVIVILFKNLSFCLKRMFGGKLADTTLFDNKL